MTRPTARQLALILSPWLLVVLGVAGAHFGVLGPYLGFRLFLIGGILAALVGVAAAFGFRRDGPWLLALVSGLAAPIGLIGPSLGSLGVPAVNDVSTDLEDPPVIDPERADGDVPLGDVSFPADTAETVRAAYLEGPDAIGTLSLPRLDRAIDASISCLRDEGTELVDFAGGSDTLQATYTTSIFRFPDDVAVRVRTRDGAVRVDVRSRSRVGKSDLGVNAARIRRILACVEERAG